MATGSSTIETTETTTIKDCSSTSEVTNTPPPTKVTIMEAPASNPLPTTNTSYLTTETMTVDNLEATTHSSTPDQLKPENVVDFSEDDETTKSNLTIYSLSPETVQKTGSSISDKISSNDESMIEQTNQKANV